MGFTGELVAACEQVWDTIRQRHPDVPPVVITLASGTAGRRDRAKLGHFAARRWEHTQLGQLAELFLSGEGLQRGPVDLLATLLHEAAHGVAFTRRVKDTSRQGRYHNRHFRALGQELGLELTVDPRIGWSLTTVPAATEAAYRPQLKLLAKALVAHRLPESRIGRTRVSNNNPLTVQCACPRRIRVAPTVLVRAPIVCGACRQPFTAY
jgi:hypothetical protein